MYKAAGTDNHARPALGGVLIEPSGKTTATDGTILVSFTPFGLADPKDYPSMEGVNPVDPVNTPLKPFILSASDVALIIRNVPKFHRADYPILQNVAIDLEQTNSGDHAVVQVAGLSASQVFRCDKIDADFPAVENAKPTGNTCFEIGLGLRALRKLVETLTALEIDFCKFSFYSADRAVKVESTNSYSDGKVEALIMPCRL